jgi:hypothetical protein
MSDTVHGVIERALAAHDGLQLLAEDVDDEWAYIQDLTRAWRDRLMAVAEAQGADAVGDDVVAAIDRLAEEVGAIDDPHRAIDWLSTYPQVVLLAVGQRP